MRLTKFNHIANAGDGFCGAGILPAIFGLNIAKSAGWTPAPHEHDTPKATEQRNPRTRGIDAKSTLEILRAIHREDATVAKAVAGALPAIARAVDAIVARASAGRPPVLRRRGNQRTPRRARCRGTSADVWHAAAHGPGRDRGRPPRADARRRRRGRQSRAGRARPGRARAQRRTTPSWESPPADRRPTSWARSNSRKTKGRGHHRHHVQPADADYASWRKSASSRRRDPKSSPARRE